MKVGGEPNVREASALARRVVGGLFDDHADAVFTYAARRVGSAAALDVVSEVFLIALDRFASYRPELGGGQGWLFGIANNVLRRHWRTEARRLNALAREASVVVAIADPLLGADRRLDAQSEVARVIRRVTQLPEDDREVLIMFAWQQLPYA